MCGARRPLVASPNAGKNSPAKSPDKTRRQGVAQLAWNISRPVDDYQVQLAFLFSGRMNTQVQMTTDMRPENICCRGLLLNRHHLGHIIAGWRS